VVKHHSFLTAQELPDFLGKLNDYNGSIQTKLALRLLILTFVRTGELRGARWSEIDWNNAEWRIPAERMKMKQLHIVPLARQSLAILRELQVLSGREEFVFPIQHNPKRFMSENTILYALYRLGYGIKRAYDSTTHPAWEEVIEDIQAYLDTIWSIRNQRYRPH
jgi:integrase